MTDLPTPKTYPKLKPHPLVASLPEHLKDPKNYKKIQKTILDAGATKHSHGEVSEWYNCVECQERQLNRVRVMRGLGFLNAAQYKAWDKIHRTITERIPSPKYNKP